MNQQYAGNMATQIEGERIAKTVTETSNALEILLNEKRFEFSKTYFALILMGGIWGWSISTYVKDSLLLNLIGMVSAVAFMLSISTFHECRRLLRQQKAILTLLKNKNLI